MATYRGPDQSVILVDQQSEPLGTATNPMVVTGGGGGGGNASVGPTGAAVPADATLIGGSDAGGLLRAPDIRNANPVGTEWGLIVRDPTLLSGNALVQVAGTGTAGAPAAGVVTIQGIVGGVAVPISAAALPLPAGAATEATLAGVLTTAAFQARINTLGQKTMANSTPVVIASDQSAIPTYTGGTSAAVTTVAGSIATFAVIAANAARKGVAIFNDTGRNLYLKFGAGATTASFTVRLTNQSYYETPFNYTGNITGICSGAGVPGNVQVTELT